MLIDSQAVRDRFLLVTLAILMAACQGTVDPFSSGSARATVTGLVTAPEGTVLRGTTIRIACAGGTEAVNAVTDSTGRYLANLTSLSDPFEGNSGTLRCQFTEPAAAPERVHMDTALGFVRGPVLVAKQFVDLREP
jgi:hypothetical protein